MDDNTSLAACTKSLGTAKVGGSDPVAVSRSTAVDEDDIAVDVKKSAGIASSASLRPLSPLVSMLMLGGVAREAAADRLSGWMTDWDLICGFE